MGRASTSDLVLLREGLDSLQALVDDHNKRSEALCKHLPPYWRTGDVPDA